MFSRATRNALHMFHIAFWATPGDRFLYVASNEEDAAQAIKILGLSAYLFSNRSFNPSIFELKNGTTIEVTTMDDMGDPKKWDERYHGVFVDEWVEL